MVARQGDHFVGDMQHSVLLDTTLAAFLDGTLQLGLKRGREESESDTNQPILMSLYLAQCPLLAGSSPSANGKALPAPGPLSPLLQDIGTPSLVESVDVWQVSFWASQGPTTSSLHYDPHSNLLCVVRGHKTLRLLPPTGAVMHALRARPPYHESANHAADDLWDDDNDLSQWYQLGMLEICLLPGDALYIPQGWWHQVLSVKGTLAVNFWWKSPIIFNPGDPEESYALRRIAQSLAARRRDEIVREAMARVPYLELMERGRAVLEGRDSPCPQSRSSDADTIDKNNDEESREYLTAAAVEILLSEASTHMEVEQAVAAALSAGGQSLERVLLRTANVSPKAMERLLLEGSGLFWELITSELQDLVGGDEDDEAPAKRDARMSEMYQSLYKCVGHGNCQAELTKIMLKRKEEFWKKSMEDALAKELSLFQPPIQPSHTIYDIK